MGKRKEPGWQYDTDANTRIKGDWQMFPVEKVCAGRVAPVHWAPNCVVGVVLSDYCNFVYDYDNFLVIKIMIMMITIIFWLRLELL